MAHVLARLAGADLSEVRRRLESDAPFYAEHGMHLEHLWRNADEPSEVLFLLRVDDLEHCRRLLERVRAPAQLGDAHARVPDTLFLDGE